MHKTKIIWSRKINVWIPAYCSVMIGLITKPNTHKRAHSAMGCLWKKILSYREYTGRGDYFFGLIASHVFFFCKKTIVDYWFWLMMQLMFFSLGFCIYFTQAWELIGARTKICASPHRIDLDQKCAIRIGMDFELLNDFLGGPGSHYA